MIPLTAELLIDVCLLIAEIGGVATALTLLTGVAFLWWIVPVGAAVWLVLWLCGFSVIEYGLGLLGLVTLSFVWSTWKLQPQWHDIATSMVPSLLHVLIYPQALTPNASLDALRAQGMAARATSKAGA